MNKLRFFFGRFSQVLFFWWGMARLGFPFGIRLIFFCFSLLLSRESRRKWWTRSYWSNGRRRRTTTSKIGVSSISSGRRSRPAPRKWEIDCRWKSKSSDFYSRHVHTEFPYGIELTCLWIVCRIKRDVGGQIETDRNDSITARSRFRRNGCGRKRRWRHRGCFLAQKST